MPNKPVNFITLMKVPERCKLNVSLLTIFVIIIDPMKLKIIHYLYSIFNGKQTSKLNKLSANSEADQRPKIFENCVLIGFNIFLKNNG